MKQPITLFSNTQVIFVSGAFLIGMNNFSKSDDAMAVIGGMCIATATVIWIITGLKNAYKNTQKDAQTAEE